MKFYLLVLMLLLSCSPTASDPENISAEKWKMLDQAEQGDKNAVSQVCADLFSEKSTFPEATIEHLKKNKEILDGCSQLAKDKI